MLVRSGTASVFFRGSDGELRSRSPHPRVRPQSFNSGAFSPVSGLAP